MDTELKFPKPKQSSGPSENVKNILHVKDGSTPLLQIKQINKKQCSLELLSCLLCIFTGNKNRWVAETSLTEFENHILQTGQLLGTVGSISKSLKSSSFCLVGNKKGNNSAYAYPCYGTKAITTFIPFL